MALQSNESTDTGASTESIIVGYLLALHIPVILFSNILVMIVFYLVKKMHTPQNTILFALSIVDLTAAFKLIFLIVELENYSIFYNSHGSCLFIMILPNLVDSWSLDILMLLCIDRFLAINFPMRYVRDMKILTVVKTVAVVLSAELLLTVVLHSLGYNYDIEKDEKDRCHYLNSSRWVLYYADIKIWIQILISVSLSGQAACVAWKRFKKKKDRMKATESNARAEQTRTQSGIITMIILMFVFMILWLPTLSLVFLETFLSIEVSTLAYMCTQHFLSINNYANAFIYAWQKPNFKKAAWYLVTHRISKWKEINRFIAITSAPKKTKDKPQAKRVESLPVVHSWISKSVLDIVQQHEAFDSTRFSKKLSNIEESADTPNKKLSSSTKHSRPTNETTERMTQHRMSGASKQSQNN